ncbi:hypothetical protein N7451_004872 [Penicillium sp. IBT 35674x]|nr:hypothetical protein N7451_004872 [Penicillium sp. IBT 35674x]
MVVPIQPPAQLTLTETSANGNGTHGIVQTKFMPIDKPTKPIVTRIPPPRLVKPDTIAALAERFNLQNFINKHEVHQKELSTIDDIDTTMIRDNEFFATMTSIDVKHSHYWGKVISARENIANHLHTALAESDHLLESLIEVIEKLDIAEHDKAVAIAKFHAAEKRREELDSQLKIANCELGQARFRMVKLAQERDAQEAKAEVAGKLLVIRDKQITTLREEINKLQLWAFKLTAQHAAAVEQAREARQCERKARLDAEAFRKKSEDLDKDNKRHIEENIKLAGKYTELSMVCSDLRRELKVKSELFTEARKDIEEFTAKITQLEEYIQILENRQKDFDEVLRQALDDRKAAIDREEAALKDRSAAEAARDEAIDNEMEAKRLYANLHIAWEDDKSALELKKEENENLKRERDHARDRAFKACHYVQESLEWGQALNLINHQLLGEWTVMKDEKIHYLHVKLEAEKELYSKSEHAKRDDQTIISLENELSVLRTGAHTLKSECHFRERQYLEAKEVLQAELDEKTDELASAQLEQLGWNKEKADLFKTNQNMTSELRKATAQIHELKAQHASAETVLKQDVEKLAHTIKELEEGRQSHEKALKQDFEAQLAAAKKEAEAEKKAMETARQEIEANLKKEVEQAKQGQEFDHLWIQDVFYAGKRLEDHKELDDIKRKEIFSKIAGIWGTNEGFQLEQFFEEKKKPIVVICRLKKGDKPVRIFDTSEGWFRFVNRK